MRMFLNRLRALDWPLNIAVFTLFLLGVAAIYSVALSRSQGDFALIQKQSLAAAVGLLLYAGFAIFHYRRLRNYAFLFYIVGILFLIGVLFFGVTIRGTTGWFQIGPLHFQPIEFMKIASAIALATYFSQRARKRLGWREIFESGVLIGVPVLLTLLQPDFGSAMLLLGMWGILLLFAGIKMQHVLLLVLLAVILSFVGWNVGLEDYQKARLTTFVNPAADPLGEGYNVRQAIIAVGAGGLVGRGLGFGSQSQLKFLPESQTDFIFAVIAEELGFVGVSLVLAAFAVLFFRMYLHALRTNDDFTGFLLVAVGAILFVQFFVNTGMNLGILPVTGVGLPLVSYGGSSLIATFVLLGIVQSVALREGHGRVIGEASV